jgi:hypothetical protein
VLRIVGTVCLLSNLAIGIWIGAADTTTGQKAVAMGLLAVLVVLGILCLARSAQLAQTEAASLRATAAGNAAGAADAGRAAPGPSGGEAQPPTVTDDGE